MEGFYALIKGICFYNIIYKRKALFQAFSSSLIINPCNKFVTGRKHLLN